ncbi:MAG TPA: hypothetical protein VG939_16760 [Caulobacteraceae bacterium]|nr:hypothetical protein [Caulobacteraceae bacterium]
MPRLVTAIALSLASLVCLGVAWFFLAVAFKDGLPADPVALGGAAIALGFVGAMWLAFARRWTLAAWLLGAAPVAIVWYFLATFRLRMF